MMSLSAVSVGLMNSPMPSDTKTKVNKITIEFEDKTMVLEGELATKWFWWHQDATVFSIQRRGGKRLREFNEMNSNWKEVTQR